jgi:MFS family permease
MLLIPFFFRRLGVKWMILVGMAAWVARYVLFALGAPEQVTWMLLLGVILHGVCYDFFFVTGFMYTDKKASDDVRNQAQSMLVFFTQGVGMFFGYWIAGDRFGSTMTNQGALDQRSSA